MAKYSELGKTGLDAWLGQIKEDFLTELRGKEGYKRYNEMRLNSPIVGAILLAIEQSIRGVDWTFSSDNGEEDPRLEILNDSLDVMSHSWNDHITEALTFLPFGWASFEIVYQPDGGRVLWRKFAIRGQDTLHKWFFDDKGGLAGWVQRIKWAEEFTLPIEKLILYRARTEKNNPEGRSVLRASWVPYYYVKHLQQIEAIGEERGLAGLPVLTLPPGANTDESDTSSDYSKALKIGRNIRVDEQAAIVLPSEEWGLELLSSGINRAFQTDAIIKRYESRILMSTLTQFLMLGQDRVGTQALSSDQTDFFTMSVNATADIIAETVTKYAIPRLLKLNGQDAEGLRLEHSLAGDIDLAMLSEFLQKLGTMITWMPEDEKWLRSVARLPEREVEEIEAAKDAAFAQQQAMMQQRASAFGNRDGDESGDDMTAELYAAESDEERQRWERRYQRQLKRHLAEIKARVLKGARRIDR